MSENNDECAGINPNVRDICSGHREGMTLTQVNHRRMLWGIPPLQALPTNADGEVMDSDTHQEPSKPYTTLEKIASFAAVTSSTVWRYVTLRPGLLTNEQMQTRIDICLSCENLIGNTCRVCGCACNKENTAKFMNKLAHRDSTCPLPVPKWGKFQENSDNS